MKPVFALIIKYTKADKSNLRLNIIDSNFVLRRLNEMARGIIIFGSSSSGKTTLGKLVAEKIRINLKVLWSKVMGADSVVVVLKYRGASDN